MSVRALLAGGSAPPSSSFSGCIKCVRVLRGNIFPAVEAERLHVAAARRLYCSPYLLITSDSLTSPLPTALFWQSLVNEIMGIIEDFFAPRPL